MKVEQLVPCLALASVLVAGHARADDAGVKPAPAAKSDAGVRGDGGPGPVDGGPLPAGHPALGADADDELGGPGGDPHAGGEPHAGHAGEGGGGMPKVPKDAALEDPSIEKGAIQIHVANADGNPIPRQEVTLGILYNSVAKGESRKRVTAVADDTGTVTFKDLDVGTGVAYRPMVLTGGATFALTPFQLSQKSGMRVLLHVFPVEHDVEKTLLVTESMTYAEVKDDRVQISQVFNLYNFGKVAWVPEDYTVPLPPEFTAFSTQQGMTDVTAEAVAKKGVKIRGTFPPGQHAVEFRWQLPYNGEADVLFDVGMTPHMARARVIAPASKQMQLEVAGFPPPQPATDGMGQRALVTQKELGRNDEVLNTVKVAIHGLPTEGPGKFIATFLAACGIAIGGFVSAKKPTPRNLPAERERLLGELSALERALAAGDVGPKTYERNKRNLLDDLARTYAAEPPKATKKKKAA